MSEQHPQSADRRRFLRDSLTLSAAAAAVSTVAVADAAELTTEAVAEPPAQRGYSLTEHVADYYKTAAL